MSCIILPFWWWRTADWHRNEFKIKYVRMEYSGFPNMAAPPCLITLTTWSFYFLAGRMWRIHPRQIACRSSCPPSVYKRSREVMVRFRTKLGNMLYMGQTLVRYIYISFNILLILLITPLLDANLGAKYPTQKNWEIHWASAGVTGGAVKLTKYNDQTWLFRIRSP